jgi:outer membrane lipoprotein-sorting protein
MMIKRLIPLLMVCAFMSGSVFAADTAVKPVVTKEQAAKLRIEDQCAKDNSNSKLSSAYQACVKTKTEAMHTKVEKK